MSGNFPGAANKYSKRDIEALRSRSAAEWDALVSSVPNADVRARAASIAWWDLQVESLEHWLHEASATAPTVHEQDLIAALESLGYPHDLAARRARPPKVNDDAIRMRARRHYEFHNPTLRKA